MLLLVSVTANSKPGKTTCQRTAFNPQESVEFPSLYVLRHACTYWIKLQVPTVITTMYVHLKYCCKKLLTCRLASRYLLHHPQQQYTHYRPLSWQRAVLCSLRAVLCSMLVCLCSTCAGMYAHQAKRGVLESGALFPSFSLYTPR